MTAPAIDTASIEHLDHQPACESRGCDRSADWMVYGHECRTKCDALVLLCDQCHTRIRAFYERLMPATCQCELHWQSVSQWWRREERIR